MHLVGQTSWNIKKNYNSSQKKEINYGKTKKKKRKPIFSLKLTNTTFWKINNYFF